MFSRNPFIAALFLRTAIIALVYFATAAYFSLSVPTLFAQTEGQAEEQVGPRVFLPYVADDQDADDLVTSAEDNAGQESAGQEEVAPEATGPEVPETEVPEIEVTQPEIADAPVEASQPAEAEAGQVEAGQVEASQAAGQQLYLSYIVNDPDVAAQSVSGDDLLNSLTVDGVPTVGHEGIDDENIEAVASANGTAYYVDCKAGNDNNNGKSKSAAWKSVTQANKADLRPGDRMLFKRGCGWVGPLDITWSGTASKRILIGAYGSGELPKIRDGYLTNVRISGSYVVVENLHATMSKPFDPDPNCQNQPRGRKTGFGFADSASYNILRNSKATKLSIGISTAYKSKHNKILYNTITDNHMVWTLTAKSTSGATGILLHGNHQEIARNFFARNRPICNYTGVLGGISIELYGASNANIHHNVIQGDRVFTELGSSPDYIARDNVFAYNLHISGYSSSEYGPRFVVTRGYGHAHGPVTGTKVYNNIVYFSGTGSKAVTCEKCGPDILTLKNNILWASQPFWSDTPFGEARNVYWDSDGKPALKWNGGSMHAKSLIANPRFVNASNGNFRLQSNSPAINRGGGDWVATSYNRDLDKKKVPIANAPDAGSYEFAR